MKCTILCTDEDHDILQRQHAYLSFIHEQVVLSRLFEQDHDIPRVSWLVNALSPVSHIGLYQG